MKKAFATTEEYFLSEDKSEVKHELFKGNLIAMTGVSFEHNEITLSTALILKQLLKGSKWKLAIETVKVKDTEGNFFYPDLMVCHPNPDKYFSDQPVLLIEVLANATRQFDVVEKFIKYKKIETLQYYICLESEQQVALFYSKNSEGEWTLEILTKEESTINLPEIKCNFSLKQIYNPE